MTSRLMTWRFIEDRHTPIEPVDLLPPPNTLDQVSQLLPNGAYTTFRTFHRTKALLLPDHFNRLEETARLEDHPVSIDRERLREALRQAIAVFAGEARIRLTLDLVSKVGDIYISLEPLRTPSETQYQNGVQVLTTRMHRENPHAKVTEFIAQAGEMRLHLPKGIEEILMVGEDGRVLEGLSSNFFAVLEGVLWTAEEGVLKGITRSLALEAAKQIDIPTRFEGIMVQAWGNIQEAFITSSTRGVLPVTVIDGSKVGNGLPGPYTCKLAGRFNAELDRLIETI